jgi:hypothetical protein
MLLAYDKTLAPATGHPAQPQIETKGRRLNIFVVFTAVDTTLEALKEAGRLAQSLGAKITLLVPQVVPYHLPLESPPVLLDFNEKRFSVIASQSPVETNVLIYLCRDMRETLCSALSRGSIVVVGGRKRMWWPTADELLARELSRSGFEVIFKEVKG